MTGRAAAGKGDTAMDGSSPVPPPAPDAATASAADGECSGRPDRPSPPLARSTARLGGFMPSRYLRSETRRQRRIGQKRRPSFTASFGQIGVEGPIKAANIRFWIATDDYVSPSAVSIQRVVPQADSFDRPKARILPARCAPAMASITSPHGPASGRRIRFRGLQRQFCRNA